MSGKPIDEAVVYVECRECRNCEHAGINDACATNAACHSCEWSGPSPTEDKCPGCGDSNCMGAACPKCGSLYRLIAEADVTLTAAQQQGQAVASDQVRRLVGKLDQWRYCMSHNESYFGEPAGLVKATVAELARAVDPIYPPKPEPIDPLAGVVIHAATIPLSGDAPNPPTPRDLAYAEAANPRASTPSAPADTAPPPSVPVGAAWSDEQIIAACNSAGVRWIEPDGEEGGFPGGFDMTHMPEMRRLFAALAQQPAAVDEALSRDELDLCRQWFDSVQDTNGGYLSPPDYVLAAKLYRALRMRVPQSISRIADQHGGSGNG